MIYWVCCEEYELQDLSQECLSPLDVQGSRRMNLQLLPLSSALGWWQEYFPALGKQMSSDEMAIVKCRVGMAWKCHWFASGQYSCSAQMGREGNKFAELSSDAPNIPCENVEDCGLFPSCSNETEHQRKWPQLQPHWFEKYKGWKHNGLAFHSCLIH